MQPAQRSHTWQRISHRIESTESMLGQLLKVGGRMGVECSTTGLAKTIERGVCRHVSGVGEPEAQCGVGAVGVFACALGLAVGCAATDRRRAPRLYREGGRGSLTRRVHHGSLCGAATTTRSVIILSAYFCAYVVCPLGRIVTVYGVAYARWSCHAVKAIPIQVISVVLRPAFRSRMGAWVPARSALCVARARARFARSQH